MSDFFLLGQVRIDEFQAPKQLQQLVERAVYVADGDDPLDTRPFEGARNFGGPGGSVEQQADQEELDYLAIQDGDEYSQGAVDDGLGIRRVRFCYYFALFGDEPKEEAR